MQVIMVVSEKATGGFFAPSITILARDGWKGGATVEKCQERRSKLNFSLRQKTLKDSFEDFKRLFRRF